MADSLALVGGQRSQHSTKPGAAAGAAPPFVLHRGDVTRAYAGWPTPVTIVSDGA